MQTSKITKIEFLGLKSTIDIEIDSNDHIFYGNGIATSNSHSWSYSIFSYWTAYAKVHFSKEFFTSYLRYARHKPKPQIEIYELVNDAKSFNIYIQPPDISLLNNEFILKDDKIYFGLVDIKNVGNTVIEKAKSIVDKLSPINTWLWIDFLINLSQELNSRAVESLIAAGACDIFNETRRKMLFELGLYSELTAKEQLWIKNNISKKTNLLDILEIIVSCPTGRNQPCANKKRQEKIQSIIQSLKKPPYPLIDSPHQIAQAENKLLGVCLTANHLDESQYKFMANCSCEEFSNGFQSQNSYISIACVIDDMRENKIKKGVNIGRDMCHLVISDETGSYEDVVIFPDEYEQCSHLVEAGNRVLVTGQRSRKNKDSLVVQNIEQI